MGTESLARELEHRLDNLIVCDAEDEEFLDYLSEEFLFWTRQAFHFEIWWMDNPESRAELIVYTPPARIGATP